MLMLMFEVTISDTITGTPYFPPVPEPDAFSQVFSQSSRYCFVFSAIASSICFIVGVVTWTGNFSSPSMGVAR